MKLKYIGKLSKLVNEFGFTKDVLAYVRLTTASVTNEIYLNVITIDKITKEIEWNEDTTDDIDDFIKDLIQAGLVLENNA